MENPAAVMDRAESAEPSATDLPSVFVERLTHEINTRWQYAYNHKHQYIEPRLYDCQRRRNGEYDPAKLAAIAQMKGSTSFLKHTALKCRAAQAWIRDVLLPGKGQPWGVEPTPLPDLPEEDVEMITQEVLRQLAMMQMQTGMAPNPDDARALASETRDEIDAERREEAKERAGRMERKIDDLFVEGGFTMALVEFVDDITTFPSAVLKGPVMERRKSLAWGKMGLEKVDQAVPCYHRVSPWDFYPSPECAKVNEGYIFERRRVTATEVRRLRNAPGYNNDEIAYALMYKQEHSTETPVDDSERAWLEEKDKDAAAGTEDERCELLEYWGDANGQWLLDWGLSPEQVPDPEEDYQICAVMVNGRIIKAMLNPDPLGRRPYYVTSFEKRTGSIWGVAIPELMDDIQDFINSAMRNLQDNMAFAGGPQVIVDLDAIDDSQRATAATFYPRKIWLVNSHNRIGQTSGKPVEFYQPNMNARELIAVLDKMQQLADDHTGIPAYAYGSDDVKGAGETMGGLSMLMNAASKGIRQVIANIGMDVLIPLVEGTFTWCMLYEDDPLIKGDAKVHARGALAQVIREQLAVNRNEFATTVMQDPDIKGLLGPLGQAKILRPILRDLELEDALPSDDEMQRNIAAQQAAMQQNALSEPAAAGEPPSASGQSPAA